MKKAQPVISHILLCDDDPDDHYFFTLALNDISPPPKVTFVHSGEEMLTSLSAFGEADMPQLIFLDYTLPFDGGTNYLKKLKATEDLREIPVIIQSDHMDEAIEACYKAGAHLFFQKPYKISTYSKNLKLILSMEWWNNIPRPGLDKFVIIDPDAKKFNR